MMKTYQGTHGVHILEYQSKINKLLCYLTNRYPRLTAVRVDLHYPKIVDDGDNKAIYNRQTMAANIQRGKRADGLTFANVSENPITDNVPRELSKMASRSGMLMTVDWQRSDIRLLTPGMPVRVYYDNGSSTQTLEGTLLRAEEMWNTEDPGMTQKMQVSAASLTFFLRKPA